MTENNNTDEKSAAEQFESFKSKYDVKEQQSNTQQESIAQDSVSFGASGVGISLDSEGVDPITESIRKEILQKQREQLRLFFMYGPPVECKKKNNINNKKQMQSCIRLIANKST